MAYEFDSLFSPTQMNRTFMDTVALYYSIRFFIWFYLLCNKGATCEKAYDVIVIYNMCVLVYYIKMYLFCCCFLFFALLLLCWFLVLFLLLLSVLLVFILAHLVCSFIGYLRVLTVEPTGKQCPDMCS